MNEMSGGDAIVLALLAHDVDTVFGLPGVQMYPLFDALHRAAPEIETITPRHEQACGYMAFGYAKATGRPGIFSVVPGPGVLNTTAAISTAWACNAPVLCLTGQIPSAFIGKRRGHLHEIPDQLTTLRSLTKWAERIERPADAPAAIQEAFHQMTSGRPGPVALEMAWDVMASSEPVHSAGKRQVPQGFSLDRSQIDQALQFIEQAQRPLIIVGSGAQHASGDVTRLAECLDAPVTTMRGGHGVVAADHPLFVNCVAARHLWPDVDLLLGIGSRLELPYMRWTGMKTLIEKPEPPPHLVRIDIDPAEMTRLVPQVGIVGDAGTVSSTLASALGEEQPKRPEWRQRINDALQRSVDEIEQIQPQMAYLNAIRASLPRDGIFVEELCQAGYASMYGFPVYQPRGYITCGFQGTLGYGYATALGVKAAFPDRAVVAIAGDGGFMFSVQELATAAQYGLGLICVLFDNSAFGNVRRDQQHLFDGRIMGSDLQNPDFVSLADSFGVASEIATGPEELEKSIAAALALNKPRLIVVPVDGKDETSPWPLIIPGMK